MTTANAPTNAAVSIDSLLDGTLDDLADIPEFKPFPLGAHRATINWEVKAVNNVPCIELKVTGIETLELTNPDDVAIKAGDSTNVIFMLKKKDGTENELAQGQWKELLKPLAAHFGTTSNRDTMEKSNGAECVVVTGIRADKRDAQNIKYYTTITNLQLV